jgi:thioredoxin 1
MSSNNHSINQSINQSDAYTQWCGPCKVIEPLINQIATKYTNQLSVLKYDVEGPKNELLKVEMLLQNVRVSGLPTLILYWRGKPVAMHSGVINEEGLEDFLDKNLFSNEALLVDGSSNDDAITKKAKEDAAGDDEDSTTTAGKRGFVSFASQYGRDDYAL